jgi:glycosyltransferase involved in cell wall biosynthesis
MSDVKLSIVTVTYNAEKFVENTLKSVISQNFPDMEYIVIDGKSTDGTLAIINSYASHIQKIVSEPDNGIFDAMNKAIGMAKGEWIYFLNAGDLFANNNVLNSIPWQELNTKTAFYGDMIYVRGSHEEFSKSRPVAFLHESMPASHQAFFVKTQAAKATGFDLQYKYAADYDMMFRLINEYGDNSFAHIPLVIAKYEAAEGFSSRYPNDVFGEVITIRSHIKKNWRWYWDYAKYSLKKNIGYKSQHS